MLGSREPLAWPDGRAALAAIDAGTARLRTPLGRYPEPVSGLEALDRLRTGATVNAAQERVAPIYVDARGSVHPAAIEAAAMRTFARLMAMQRRYRAG